MVLRHSTAKTKEKKMATENSSLKIMIFDFMKFKYERLVSIKGKLKIKLFAFKEDIEEMMYFKNGVSTIENEKYIVEAYNASFLDFLSVNFANIEIIKERVFNFFLNKNETFKKYLFEVIEEYFILVDKDKISNYESIICNEYSIRKKIESNNSEICKLKNRISELEKERMELLNLIQVLYDKNKCCKVINDAGFIKLLEGKLSSKRAISVAIGKC